MVPKNQSNQYLLVAGVVEGKNFPTRPHHKIVVEAKFGGEILSTDEVDHYSSPEFHQELAWELDKKSLHEHRIQRSVIKVQVFAVDTRTLVRELIGYNVIDLNNARSAKPNIKWYSMLHCRYPKSKPEIKIGMYLEDQPPLTSSKGISISSSPSVFRDLKPIWHTDNGDYYQLGPADKCNTYFCLSITIASAAHLTGLISSEDVSEYLAVGKKFFFVYNLFGCNIATEHFSNVEEPNFLPERTSVRIRSSIEALRQYFTKQPPFQVSLYCVGTPMPLGSCQLSLCEILPTTIHELQTRPMVVDCHYRLSPSKSANTKLDQLPNDLQPILALTLSFKLDNSTISNASTSSPAVTSSRKDSSQLIGPQDFLNSPIPGSQAVDNGVRKHSHLSHFELAVELGSVTLTEGAQPLAGVTLCCSCGLFLTAEGEPTSLTTQPPVELITGGVPVPLAFSRFVVEFASRADRIISLLSKHDVKIQLWSETKTSSTPVLAAVGVLNLTRLAEASPIVVLGREGKTVEQQSITESVALILAGELATGGTSCANVTASIVLRNLGTTTENESPTPSPKPNKSKNLKNGKSLQKPSKSRTGHVHGIKSRKAATKSAVDSGKVQAALELELWKDAQEKLFEKQLKTREVEHMKEMAEEWHRRDQQRQQLLTKKMDEYNRLESELRGRIGEIDRREVELRAGERDLEHLRSELARYKEQRTDDVREAAKRMEEEASHRIGIEKMRANHLDEELQKTKILLHESEEKYRRLERDFAAVKQQQRLAAHPDPDLMHKANMLTLDKEELEKRVESLQKAKLHYKQQWGHALRELTALRQEQNEQSRNLVEKQQRELEQMRLRYLADEEKKLLNSDFEELKRFREEISNLGISSEPKRLSSPEQRPSSKSPVRPSSGLAQRDIAEPPAATGFGASDSDYISRLMEERDTLLRTGVYSADDRIIVNLEKKINAALAAR